MLLEWGELFGFDAGSFNGFESNKLQEILKNLLIRRMTIWSEARGLQNLNKIQIQLFSEVVVLFDRLYHIDCRFNFEVIWDFWILAFLRWTTL